MTQPAYSDVKPYLDNGDSNASVADDLSYITNGAIGAESARTHLVEEGLWAETPSGFEGGLQTAYEDAGFQTPAANIAALDLLWGTAFRAAQPDCLTTTQLRPNGIAKSAQQGTRLGKMLGRAVTGAFITQNDLDNFNDIGGGLKYPAGVTDVEVQAAIDQEVLDVATQARRDSGRTTVQTLAAQGGVKDDAATAQHQANDYTDAVTDHDQAIIDAYNAA